jgi:hypothetical protein
MSNRLTEIFQSVINDYQTLFEDGIAFSTPERPTFELSMYLHLIKILDAHALPNAVGDYGFWKKYTEIETRGQGDPALKSDADVTRVRYLLHQKKPTEATAIARSIIPLTSPNTDIPGLIESSLFQVRTSQAHAFTEIAGYFIRAGDLETAYALALESKRNGDIHWFSTIFLELCQIYEKQGQLERRTELLTQLQEFIAEFSESGDFIKKMAAGMIRGSMEEIIEGPEENPLSGIDFGFAGWRVDKKFNLSQAQLRAKLAGEVSSLAQIQGLEKKQFQAATITVSTCRYVSRRSWNDIKPTLYELLKEVSKEYFARMSELADEDGGPTHEDVIARQGSVTIAIVDPSKEPPSRHGLDVMSLELAYTTAKFEDYDFLEQLFQEHFSLLNLVHLYQRPAFQELSLKK